MHRDYNYDPIEANTQYDPENPQIEFGDLANPNAKDESNLKLYDKDELKKSKKPLLVENYGLSDDLHVEDDYLTGSDIYLAADGTWRYRAEHVRLPILRSRY